MTCQKFFSAVCVFVLFVAALAPAEQVASGPLPPPDPVESQRQPSQSTQAAPEATAPSFSRAPDSIEGRVPIVLRASRGVAPFRIAPRVSPALYRAQSATFIINYIPAGTQNALGDNCLNWPAGSQAAFQYAANLWGQWLNSTVPIKIDACWASLGEGVLGHSATDSFYRNFSGAPQPNTWYSVALANALSGTDRNGNTAEMHIAYSSSSSFTWYFGADGNPPMSQYDFVSVVLHEIAHGLNFAGSMWVDIPGYIGCGSVGWGCWGLESSPPYYPVIYDRFAEDGNAVSLLNTGAYPNPSTALGNALRGQVSGVYFNGANAKAANGNSRVKLYAPSTWRPGSSYAHLDEMFNGTANALMTYSLDDGEAVHTPGQITCGILRDLGWPNACGSSSPAAPSALTATPLSQSQIRLSWTDNSNNENGFKVERSPDGTSGWAQITTVVTDTQTYTNTGLTCNTPYYYRVRAYNGGGDSDYSNTADATTSACPSAPDVNIGVQTVGSNLKPGDFIAFTLAIANTGNLVASRVVVTDIVPAPVLSLSYASTLAITPTGVYSYVWDVGTLGIGQSGVITIYGQIDPGLANGFSFTNSAIISDPQDNTPDNNTDSVTVGNSKVYLPLVMKPWSLTPGFWQSTNTAHEFYVTSDGAYVHYYEIYITVPGCGNYSIRRNTDVPISNNSFSFAGAFYASGTFNSSTTASATDGLNSFPISGCGTVSGGPWSYTASWQYSSQIAFMSAEVLGTYTVEPSTATGETGEIVVAPVK